MELTEEQKAKRARARIFRLRLAGRFLLAIAAPFAYIAAEYGIFKPEGSRSFSGRGIIGILIAFIAVVVAAKTAISAFPKGHVVRQYATGAVVIAAMVGMLFGLKALEDALEELEHLLVFLIIVEGAAIPLNPLPKRAYDHNIELFTGKMTEAVANGIRNRFAGRKKE